MGRAPCCDKANVKKGPWSPEEDAKLKAYIQDHGIGGNWIALPHKIGLKRCGKSCRLRWLNYLRPNIKHGSFSEEEDNIICTLFLSIGSRWSIIASQLPGRTDNDIKNYWNTKLKKKLMGKQCKAGQMARRETVITSESTTIENNHMVYKNIMNPNPYYPELPVQVPTLDPSPDGHVNEQDYIMKFLVSLEGKCYHDHQQPNIETASTNLEYPLEYFSPYQDIVYDNSINSLSSTNSMNGNFSHLPMYQGFNNQTHEQLETCFGVDIVNCKSWNSYVESSNLGDINSTVYDPIMGVQDCVLQESSCFGEQ